MWWIAFKYLTTAAIVVLISEVAKRSDKLGALVAALPTVTILALIWMYIEGQGQEKLSNHAFYTFWYVVPTLPMFLLFPYLLNRYSFWLTLLICCFVSVVSFGLTAYIAKVWGIRLL
ncbi:4-amino-4-deoxy-L-arabinose transferase [Photobacterium aphoticum]|uniref:4-amino-4-deoxy-L-arabinose transferase n=1 Tax=Photobacterium aphoticum TaxID=754436 RepID=A0A090R364_9GAMM|nr:4-amino-4-deoxy-L-arabinose transferase [Photobacterium aphoticum]